MFCPSPRVGWSSTLPLSRYNDRFRRYRRAVHQFIGTKAVLAPFAKTMDIESHRFLNRTMRDPSTLFEQIRRTAGAIILKISHGYTIEPEGTDYFVDLANNVLHEFLLAATPGLWMVDIMPFRVLLSHHPEILFF